MTAVKKSTPKDVCVGLRTFIIRGRRTERHENRTRGGGTLDTHLAIPWKPRVEKCLYSQHYGLLIDWTVYQRHHIEEMLVDPALSEFWQRALKSLRRVPLMQMARIAISGDKKTRGRVDEFAATGE